MADHLLKPDIISEAKSSIYSSIARFLLSTVMLNAHSIVVSFSLIYPEGHLASLDPFFEPITSGQSWQVFLLIFYFNFRVQSERSPSADVCSRFSVFSLVVLVSSFHLLLTFRIFTYFVYNKGNFLNLHGVRSPLWDNFI